MLMAVVRELTGVAEQSGVIWHRAGPVDIDRARAQQAGYRDTLRALGAAVVVAPRAGGGRAIAEDVVALDEVVVVTRGAGPAERPGTAGLVECFGAVRPVHVLDGEITITGRDILRVQRTLYVGLAGAEVGVAHLRRVVGPLGYEVKAVRRYGLVPLTAAASYLGNDTILVDPAVVDITLFTGMRVVTVADGEPGAAGVLVVGRTVVLDERAVRTRALLEREGFRTVGVDVGELVKLGASVNALSVLLETDE